MTLCDFRIIMPDNLRVISQTELFLFLFTFFYHTLLTKINCLYVVGSLRSGEATQRRLQRSRIVARLTRSSICLSTNKAAKGRDRRR